MKYIIKGRVISTENTAKPASQASSYLVSYLRELKSVRHSLDYGCGKLRYTKHLNEISKQITVVDSEHQLSRIQIIHQTKTSIREFLTVNWPTINVESVEEFREARKPKFDFVLCSNVLSAIPCFAERSRVLGSIYERLEPKGLLLVINQHSNSYFDRFRTANGAREHLDGYVVPFSRGYSYYGILTRQRVSEILVQHGFQLVDSWVRGQSNYALVTK